LLVLIHFNFENAQSKLQNESILFAVSYATQLPDAKLQDHIHGTVIVKMMAYHSIYCLKSMLMSLQCYLADGLDKGALYMTSAFLTSYTVRYQSVGIGGRCDVQSCVHAALCHRDSKQVN
jgi:hypothetical protein